MRKNPALPMAIDLLIQRTETFIANSSNEVAIILVRQLVDELIAIYSRYNALKEKAEDPDENH